MNKITVLSLLFATVSMVAAEPTEKPLLAVESLGPVRFVQPSTAPVGRNNDGAYPGRRSALPWATVRCPVGADAENREIKTPPDPPVTVVVKKYLQCRFYMPVSH